MPLILLGVAVLLAGIGVTLFLVLGGDDGGGGLGGGGNSQARDAAQGFMEAVENEDIDGLRENACAELADGFAEAVEEDTEDPDSGIRGFQLGEQRTDGDTILINVTVQVENSPGEVETDESVLVLEREGGSYKVCDVQTPDGDRPGGSNSPAPGDGANGN